MLTDSCPRQVLFGGEEKRLGVECVKVRKLAIPQTPLSPKQLESLAGWRWPGEGTADSIICRLHERKLLFRKPSFTLVSFYTSFL